MVYLLQYYRHTLEDEYGGLRDNFETFTLYRGKKSLDDEDDDANRLAGYFKVKLCDFVMHMMTTRIFDLTDDLIL